LTFVAKIVVRGLRLYWRATRGLALSAEACLLDVERRVALVKAPTDDGWRLPRTTVRKGEALDEALRRLLWDEHGIRIDARPDLFWLYADGPGHNGQAGFYIVRHWRQERMTAASGLSFFGVDALPDGLASQDAARIRQAIEGRAPFEVR
jgi:8-oxo-dGTP pyrophosphatase MutT (NUDIX family)